MNKMNFKVFGKIGRVLAVGILAISVVSCEKDDDTKNDDNDRTDQYFNVVYSGSSVGGTATWAQALTTEEISDPNEVITFIGVGYEIPSTRTARVYASEDGRSLYNLDYGGAELSKFDVFGRQDYRMVSERNMYYAIGTTHPRWTKFSEENALIHTVTPAVRIYKKDEDGKLIIPNEYLYTESGARLVEIELSDMSFDDVQGFTFPRSEEDKEKGLHIGRIDAPVVLNGKAYYGLFKSKYDPDENKNIPTGPYQSTTLVVDYPSLANPTTISSEVAQGSTQGYRIPVSYAIDNSIYQITDAPSHILKITNGAYDNSYVFNLSEALGFDVGADGWFYVDNGIGYVVYFDAKIGSSSKLMAWGVARVDILNKTAIDMNVPDNLSLGQLQFAKVGADGKLYMALTPIGGNGTPGNIYIFDPTIADKDGFTKGAKLTSGAGGSYIGVF